MGDYNDEIKYGKLNIFPDDFTEEDIDMYTNDILYQHLANPQICYKCKTKELEEYNQYYDDCGIIEYSVRCSKCKTKLGHWAYGEWLPQ